MEELIVCKVKEKELVLYFFVDVFDEWLFLFWLEVRNKGFYEFYNVMWIKWLDEGEIVVERVVVGRIEKGVWEGKEIVVRVVIIV